jgi:hypothetical protein
VPVVGAVPRLATGVTGVMGTLITPVLFRLDIASEGRPNGPSVLLSKSRLVRLSVRDIFVLARGICVLCRGGALATGVWAEAIWGADCALEDFSSGFAPLETVLLVGMSAIWTEGRCGRWGVAVGVSLGGSCGLSSTDGSLTVGS